MAQNLLYCLDEKGAAIKRMIVSVDTGHGKSVVIQLLADMLVKNGAKNVLIVCLNDFLSYFGEEKYGTSNV